MTLRRVTAAASVPARDTQNLQGRFSSGARICVVDLPGAARPGCTERRRGGAAAQVLDGAFLPELSRQADPDARAVHSRLGTYLRARAWEQEPEGRALPRSDSSSYDRA